jgi:hypothetical protein
MFEFAVVAGLVGAAISIRLSVFALVPALSVLVVFLSIGEVSRGETVWSIAAAILLVATSAQLGYFAGSVLRFVLGDRRREERIILTKRQESESVIKTPSANSAHRSKRAVASRLR